MSPSELLRRLRAEGWSMRLNGSGHWTATHPQADRPISVPATPSDVRNAANVLAAARRALGRPAKARPEPAPRPRPAGAKPTPSAEQPRRPIAGGPAGYRSSLAFWN